MEPLAPNRFGARAISRPQDAASVRVQNAGTAQGAGSGVSFLARAVAAETGGRWEFISEGPLPGKGQIRFVAEAFPGLRPGDRVRVFPSPSSTRSVVYRIVPEGPPPASGLLSFLGLDGSVQSQALVSAFRFLGLPLEPPRLRRLIGKLERLGREGSEPSSAALVAAAADDKGFDASPEAILSAAALVDPRSGDGRDQRRRNSGKRPDPEDLKEAAADFQSAGHPLSFMNDADGKSGKRWVVFPINFTDSSVEIRATLSLLLNPLNEDPESRVEQCRIVVSAPSRFWTIEIIGGGTSRLKATVRGDPPLDSFSDSAITALSRALEPLGPQVVVSSERADLALLPGDPTIVPMVREEA